MQVNHFFDTAKRALRNKGLGLRLRHESSSDEGDRYFVALKGERQTDDSAPALVRRREIEFEVEKPLATEILNQRHNALDVLIERANPVDRKFLQVIEQSVGSAIQYVGHFSNERSRIDTVLVVEGDGLEIVLELDTTSYPNGIVEYEIEVELPDWVTPMHAESALRSLFAIAGVKGKTARGKAVRYFERLRTSPLGSV